MERNPIDLIEMKGVSQRKKRPQALQAKDAWQVLDALPFRTIMLIGLCFGLRNPQRTAPILGCLWQASDCFHRQQANIPALLKPLLRLANATLVADLH
ncbi:MAG TPA: hypothetical protein VN901_24865 [Candidatus Acidoferrales bacterium]|nr:hypothetical protein [Candidatus Acidoferrales bacterium]